MTPSLELHFLGGQNPQLERACFSGFGEELRESRRGRAKGKYGGENLFPWSPAVQAITIVLCRTALWTSSNFKLGAPSIEGEGGSPASSLDYALSKIPNWLFDMFGYNEDGIHNARKLFSRLNPERKRPGPVIVSVCPELRRDSSVQIYLDKNRLRTIEELSNLEKNLSSKWCCSSFENENNANASKSTTSVDSAVLIKPITSKPGGPIIYHSVKSSVDCYDPSGDAKKITQYELENLTDVPLFGQPHEAWFDTDLLSPRFEVFAFDDDNAPLATRLIRNCGNYKQFFCEFKEPLLPGQTLKYEFGWNIERLFSRGISENHHFFDVRVPFYIKEIEFSVRHKKLKPFLGCQVLKEPFGRLAVEDCADLLVEHNSEDAKISWRKFSAEAGTNFRTEWQFYP